MKAVVMRVLVLYANPSDKSFGAAVHLQVLEALRARGHAIDDCDLYDEAFNPVLSERERAAYHDASANRAPVESYVGRLLAAEALVLAYPVWNEGFPAILKGFFDRVFLPGVSFEIEDDGSPKPGLKHLKKIAAVCTYGAGRIGTFLLGDPPRRVVKRLLRTMPSHHVSCQYLALYDMNHASGEQRRAFLARTKRTFEAW